jgi:pyruvate/2-oxoacid:ferredoxin oxidoreductase alpha subunit
VEAYRCDDSDYILITLGSIFGLCSDVADELRNEGVKAGVLRLRYIRPFPNKEITEIVRNAKSIAVLEKDISFGNEGSVYTEVLETLSALKIWHVTRLKDNVRYEAVSSNPVKGLSAKGEGVAKDETIGISLPQKKAEA